MLKEQIGGHITLEQVTSASKSIGTSLAEAADKFGVFQQDHPDRTRLTKPLDIGGVSDLLGFDFLLQKEMESRGPSSKGSVLLDRHGIIEKNLVSVAKSFWIPMPCVCVSVYRI